MSTYKEYLCLFFMILLLICAIILIDTRVRSVCSDDVIVQESRRIVVIDAGHGGFDSGKVGIDGTLEKDINLIIAKKLEKLLTAADIQVVMTRTEDTGLCDEHTENKKKQDMIQRLSLMNQTSADCIVSIHQNSYPEESIDGAQVFYPAGSLEGNTLAALIQNELILDVDPSNHRMEKSNDSYYLLKNASAPIVIVECGFLSNRAESKKLVDDTYQQKLAWAIHLGILQYLNEVTLSEISDP